MAITLHLTYTGKDGAARRFAEEMIQSGTVSAIRAEKGNRGYAYYFSRDDPETLLLIDSWDDQAAIDRHHASPMMQTIAALREKHGLTMTAERFVTDELGLPEKDRRFLREETPAPGQKKGRIVFLNGVTSAGKTSIVEALQARRDVFFYVVANDLFEQMVGEDYLREDYWKYLSEAVLLMYRTAKLFSDLGKNVLIDGILVEREGLRPHYQRLTEILKGNPLDIVHVDCPLGVCRQRNLARGDRYETQSEEQAELMAKDIRYSLRVDTSRLSPEQCADAILQALF